MILGKLMPGDEKKKMRRVAAVLGREIRRFLYCKGQAEEKPGRLFISAKELEYFFPCKV